MRMRFILVTDFLSENAKFSEICRQNKIKFIGASPEMINQMGDKSNAKATMIAAGVPCVPGSVGLLESADQGKELAKELSTL
jgi:acetyl-CoA carboxylase biotin carboxylase subunit